MLRILSQRGVAKQGRKKKGKKRKKRKEGRMTLTG